MKVTISSCCCPMNDSTSGGLPASVEGKSQGPRLLPSPISPEPKARWDVIMTHTPVKHRDAQKANVHSRSNPESEKTKLRMYMWSSSTSQFSGSPWKKQATLGGKPWPAGNGINPRLHSQWPAWEGWPVCHVLRTGEVSPRTGRPEGWRNCPSCRARRKGESGRKRCYFLAQENKTHFWWLAPPLPHFWPRARSEVPGSGRCTKLLRPWGQGSFMACAAVNSFSPPVPVLWAPAPCLYITGGLGWLQGHRGGWQTLNSYHSYQHSGERWEKSSSQGRYHACENNEHRIVCKPVTRLLLFGRSTLYPFPNQNVQIHLLFGQSPIYKRVFFSFFLNMNFISQHRSVPGFPFGSFCNFTLFWLHQPGTEPGSQPWKAQNPDH